jgi:hypothetical protein
MAEFIRKRVLITVRTYPVPATKGVEVSCTAGITDDRKWIRLFPMPYRLLDDESKFKKYQWIEVNVSKAKNDSRPESYNPQVDNIQIGKTLSSERDWWARWDVMRPLLNSSLCELQDDCQCNGHPSLGFIKPKIERLLIEPSETQWTSKQQDALRQTSLFHKAPETELEKIPFDFKYEFRCGKVFCTGHRMTCTDWEMGQSYRSWRRQYRDNWEQVFRQRYETEMIEKFDTHFFVGNLHQYPNAWIVVGLFYPPQQKMNDLFSW